MSPVKKYIVLFFLLSVAGTITVGCGDSNPEATFDPVSGEEGHLPEWLPAEHAISAASDLASCAECHGPDFFGGISELACTSCHLGSETEVHPLDWEAFAYARHDTFVETNGNAFCAIASCHGAGLGGVQGSGPSCITACHLGGLDAIHPAEWVDIDTGVDFGYVRHVRFVDDNGTASCENSACHGGGDAQQNILPLSGVEESGPACLDCHLGDEFINGQWVFSFHPPEWDVNFELHGDFVASMGTASCSNQRCHGSDLGGVTSSGPSCFICHP
jgi:hypothetical protein